MSGEDSEKEVVMTTVASPRSRTITRQPLHVRPDWADTTLEPRSNTWGSGSVRVPASADRARRSRIAKSVERPFDAAPIWTRIMRRASLVIGSPGATLVALGMIAVMLGVSPAVGGGTEQTPTPAGTTVVTVGGDQSLSDIARQHVPDVPVGDAVARIASLNDVSDFGSEGDAATSHEVVLPVY